MDQYFVSLFLKDSEKKISLLKKTFICFFLFLPYYLE